jgi:CheY-like chemotaxis protein
MRPTVAEGGAAALAACQRAAVLGQPFPLILLDALMPEMDGFTLADRLRQLSGARQAVLMMLSSADRQGLVDRCRDAGIDRCLTKPIRPADLYRAILDALGLPDVSPEPAATPRPADPGPSLRVLLAEDNPVNQRLVLRMLEKRGHRVVVVGDGGQALAALDRAPFDLVLMDLQMPVMGGFEALDAIRSRERTTGGHLPVIALTANALKGDRERCLQAGFDDYIAKPLQPADLDAGLAGLGQPTAVPTNAADDAPTPTA